MTSGTIVLFGGPSRERLVSVATAQNLVTFLNDPLCWFWSPEGPVYQVSPDRLIAHSRPFEREFVPDTSAAAASLESALDSVHAGTVVVLGLHGAFGEDGTVQRWLEERGIAFTGSGSQASELAFDKVRAKEIVARGGVRVAESLVIRDMNAHSRQKVEEMLRRFGRVVWKPIREGSSYGLRIMDQLEDLEIDQEYLVEPFIAGIELTAGVIDGSEGLVGLPTVEIRVGAGRSFDYEGKYLGAGTEEICPAQVDWATEQAAREVAAVAHRTLGCYGYSRTDLVISAGTPVFLETNTLPGLTRTSLIPKELAAAGISMRDFLRDQIHLARLRAANTGS